MSSLYVSPNPGPYPGPNPTPQILAEQRARLNEEEEAKTATPPRPPPARKYTAREEEARAGATPARGPSARPPRATTKTKTTVPPYRPARTETFTAVILALLIAGVAACAAVFPYQGVRDADAAGTKWVRTLAAWSAAEKFPEVDALRPYYPEEAEAPAAAP